MYGLLTGIEFQGEIITYEVFLTLVFLGFYTTFCDILPKKTIKLSNCH